MSVREWVRCRVWLGADVIDKQGVDGSSNPISQIAADGAHAVYSGTRVEVPRRHARQVAFFFKKKLP
jgi:hypothetical protein